MKFCIVKRDMTPDKPVYLTGFWGREHKSDGVHDPIYLKAALLQANKTLLVLTFDVIGGDRSFVTGIKSAMNEKFGLQEDEILLNFSHTHCSIYLTGEDPVLRRGVYSMSQERVADVDDELDFTEDVLFYQQLKDQIVQAVEYCFAHLQEGRILIGRGTSDAAISRRLMTEEGLQFRPNPQAVIDKDLFVLKLVDSQDRLNGVLFSYGCHPSCMAGYFISADFVGQACQLVENTYPGVTALFLQGCGADIKAPLNGKFTRTSEEMREIGSRFSKDIIGIMERERFSEIACDFRSTLLDIKLFTEIMDVSEVESIFHDENVSRVRRIAAGKLLKAILDGRDRRSLNHYIQIWQLDADTTVIAMEGEIANEYSLKIKALLKHKTTIVLGYSNGVSTYIPTRKILAEGGYEAEAVILHGYRGQFIPETEDTILGAIVRMELLS